MQKYLLYKNIEGLEEEKWKVEKKIKTNHNLEHLQGPTRERFLRIQNTRQPIQQSAVVHFYTQKVPGDKNLTVKVQLHIFKNWKDQSKLGM